MTKTFTYAVMQDGPWVPYIVIGANLLIAIGLAYFRAPVGVVIGAAILCLTFIILQVWLVVRKPQQQLVLREGSLTFVGVWSETTLNFASIATAVFRPVEHYGTNVSVVTLSDGHGRAIEIHHRFVQLPGVVAFIEERLKAHGKTLQRHSRL